MVDMSVWDGSCECYGMGSCECYGICSCECYGKVDVSVWDG